MTILHIFTYISLIVLVAMVIYKYIKIASSPVHLRWELYPVPHEAGKRSSYGGSRLEEVDWWTKKEKRSFIKPYLAILEEIILLKGVWQHNKTLWTGSYPFHSALYLFSFNFVLVLVYTVLNMFSAADSTIYQYFETTVNIIAWAASAIGVIGAVRLFGLRMFNLGLKMYSNPSHYFNILLIGAFYLSSLLWLSSDGSSYFRLTSGLCKGLLTAGEIPVLSLSGYINVYLAVFFLIYLPFTHMTHFFTKYFTYHKVRWEDEALVPNSKMARKLSEQLNQTVTWSAPHIGADGRKNWLAIVNSPVAKEEK